MLLRLVTGVLLFFLISFNGSAQIDLSHRYNYAEFDTLHMNKLIFHLENTNFIKNNEYFGVSAEGYTLLGYSLAPSVMYYAGSRLRFQVGINAQKYHGAEKFSKINPVIAAHLRLTPNLDLVMGSIKSTVHHGISEPMYDHEWQYTRPVETGLQFLYTKERFWADAWLDWEQFIKPGDAFPEIFTAGISTQTSLLQSESGWKIKMPLQMMARHTGGQINEDETAMQSVINLSMGFDVSKKTDGFFNKLGWFGSVLTYNDVTEANPLGVYKGHAIYTGLKSEGKKGIAMVGYWDAKNFIAPKGSPLFQSVSAYNPTTVIPNRQLITGKIGYYRSFQTQIRFSFLFEGYYDLPNSQFDYAYGIHLSFTPNFVIAKIPFF